MSSPFYPCDAILERRVTGLFKIAIRMMSRGQVAKPLLDILGRLFASAERQKAALETTEMTLKCMVPSLVHEFAPQVYHLQF